jgi:fumarate reductase iron-sulfur subunit
MDINEIPVLLRREIEARIAGPLIQAFMEEFGREKTIEIASGVILKLAQENGRDLAERAGGNSFDDLSNATGQWSAGGAIQREVLDKSESNYDFNIVRCKYAEMYKELGLADMGFIFSCGRDGSMYSGFNDKIKLERTQTIMQGADYCDFRLSLNEDASSSKESD